MVLIELTPGIRMCCGWFPHSRCRAEPSGCPQQLLCSWSDHADAGMVPMDPDRPPPSRRKRTPDRPSRRSGGRGPRCSRQSGGPAPVLPGDGAQGASGAAIDSGPNTGPSHQPTSCAGRCPGRGRNDPRFPLSSEGPGQRRKRPANGLRRGPSQDRHGRSSWLTGESANKLATINNTVSDQYVWHWSISSSLLRFSQRTSARRMYFDDHVFFDNRCDDAQRVIVLPRRLVIRGSCHTRDSQSTITDSHTHDALCQLMISWRYSSSLIMSQAHRAPR